MPTIRISEETRRDIMRFQHRVEMITLTHCSPNKAIQLMIAWQTPELAKPEWRKRLFQLFGPTHPRKQPKQLKP